jgi:hypothetical protein
MERILVLLPAHAPAGLEWPGAEVHRYSSPLDIPGLLTSYPLPAVIARDAISPAHVERIAEAIRARQAPVIAVAVSPWDGASPDPIAAACRGVVSGFGLHAITRVLEVLRA